MIRLREGPEEITALLYSAVTVNIPSHALYYLRPLLISTAFLKAEPVRVYAIAVRFEFLEEARVASTSALAVRLSDTPQSSDLEHLRATEYHRLVSFHTKRSKRAVYIMDATANPLSTSRHYGCHCVKWYEEFRQAAKQELFIRPTTEVITSLGFLSKIMKDDEKRCNPDYCLIGEPSTFLEWVRTAKENIDCLPSSLCSMKW